MSNRGVNMRAILTISLRIPTVALANGGGLDRYGCHHNRKQGGYHCHRGPLAGQAFASKQEMLAALQKAGKQGGAVKAKKK